MAKPKKIVKRRSRPPNFPQCGDAQFLKLQRANSLMACVIEKYDRIFRAMERQIRDWRKLQQTPPV